MATRSHRTVKIGSGEYKETRTNHSVEILKAKSEIYAPNPVPGSTSRYARPPDYKGLCILAACELLQCHDDTGISLDKWLPVRAFVEDTLGFEILENHV